MLRVLVHFQTQLVMQAPGHERRDDFQSRETSRVTIERETLRPRWSDLRFREATVDRWDTNPNRVVVNNRRMAALLSPDMTYAITRRTLEWAWHSLFQNHGGDCFAVVRVR